MRPSEDFLARLRTAWDDVLRPFDAPLTPRATTFSGLAARYSEPGRHYHNLVHIGEMLGIVEELAGRAPEGTAVRLAVWFHDAVYDSRAKDNEERSAELATSTLLVLGAPATTTATVARLILLTKTHHANADDRDGLILLDADLAILGAEAPRYDEYAAAIRREYAWVADEAYRTGRRGVLGTFLKRPRIYFTDTLFGQREERARKNIGNEMDRLASG
jgi:predicted metal-dependent HD superfamily phosphohydrolase